MTPSPLDQLPSGSTHVTYTMAVLTALGGAAGFAKTRSQRSLAAGLIFGAGFGYAGYLIKDDGERGFRFGTTVSAMLTGVMGYRAYKTQKFMPAGLLAGLGLASSAYHYHKWSEWSD